MPTDLPANYVIDGLGADGLDAGGLNTGHFASDPAWVSDHPEIAQVYASNPDHTGQVCQLYPVSNDARGLVTVTVTDPDVPGKSSSREFNIVAPVAGPPVDILMVGGTLTPK